MTSSGKLSNSTVPLHQLPSLREVIQSSELWAKQSLGQNFLLDMNITRKIVQAAGFLTDATIIEIGPGPGGLTRAFLENETSNVIAIEKDSRAIKALKPLQDLFKDRLTLIEGDALKISIHTLGTEKRYVIANLPYNIATSLLMNWLEHASSFEKLILMFQKEVADRILSAPHTKSYGRLSVKVQWLCEVRRVLTLPPEVFWPSPKVYSTVVEFIPRPAPLYPANKDDLEEVLKIAFSQRRKMLRASLQGLNVSVEDLLNRANILPTLRPENLSIEDFCKLANIFRELKNSTRS